MIQRYSSICFGSCCNLLYYSSPLPCLLKLDLWLCSKSRKSVQEYMRIPRGWEETVYEGIMQERRICSWYTVYSRSRNALSAETLNGSGARVWTKAARRLSKKERRQTIRSLISATGRGNLKIQKLKQWHSLSWMNGCLICLKCTELSILKPQLSTFIESYSQLS